MKKILLLLFAIGFSISAVAQLVGGTTYPINGTDAGTTSFASLRSAIAYLQSNGVTGSGQVILEFAAPYDATLVDAPATAATKITIPNITGTSASLGITIRPAAGFSTSLSANVDATGLIDLDGGSYITIDGRPGGVGTISGLTIENLAATTTAGTAAIRLINDAHHNVITYSTLKNASTHSSSQAGTILFHTSTGTIGNSNNIISNNTLAASTGSTRTSYHILSYGSDGAPNSSNTIINNDVSRFIYRAIYVASAGAGDEWTISGNSVYSPVSVTGPAAYGICVLGTGASHVISNNFVGGQAPQCGGSQMNTLGFFAVYVSATGIGTAAIVQNNTIANISSNYTSTGLTGNSSIHHLIYVTGNVDVLNNTLGSQTSTNNIILATNNTQAFAVFATPIYVSGSGIINVKNNLVGGITYNATGASTSGYYGRMVYVNSTSLVSLAIENNTFGGSVANSIQNTGTGRVTYLQGLFLTAIGGNASILNNTIRNFSGTTDAGITGISLSAALNGTVSGNNITNLTSTGGGTGSTISGISASATGTGLTINSNSISNLITNGTSVTNGSSSVLTGIALGSTGSGITATNNSVFNLTCTGAAATHVIGVGSYGGRQISGNKIYNLYNTNATTGGTIKGIVLRWSGTFNAYNNIISLTGVNNDVAVYGFETNGTTVGTNANIYHNTVHIDGSITSGISASAGVFTNNATPFTLNNNILSVSRGGGSGTHVSINNAAAAAASTNYNLYIYPSATTSDPNSQAFNYGDVGKPTSPAVFFADNSSPYFMSVSASNDSFFKNLGTPIASVTTDIVNNTRSATTPSLGAYETNTTTLLPVNISTFTAKLNNNKVALNWTVGTETNVNRYEVERSVNGVDFVKVAEVAANGSSSYATVDASPVLGINYYRLKAIDHDGTLSRFNEVRSVKVATLEEAKSIIYPNPVIGNEINVSLIGYPAGNYSYKVLSALGIIVQTGQINNSGSAKNTISLNGQISKGIYILYLANGKETIQSKFIKN